MQIKKEYQNITSDRRNYFLDGVSYPRVSTILKNIDKSPLIKWASKMAVEKVRTMLDDKLSIANMGYSFDTGFKETMLELAVKEHTRILDEANEYGSLIHNAIETWLKKGDIKKIAKNREELAVIKIQLDIFKQFWEEGKFELIKSEMAVVSKVHEFGGRIDILARQGNDTVLIDIKTGKSIWKSAKVQCGLYVIALEEMIGDKQEGFICYYVGCERISIGDKVSKAIILHMPRYGLKLKKPKVLEGEEFKNAKKAGLNLVNLYYNLKGVK